MIGKVSITKVACTDTLRQALVVGIPNGKKQTLGAGRGGSLRGAHPQMLPGVRIPCVLRPFVVGDRKSILTTPR